MDTTLRHFLVGQSLIAPLHRRIEMGSLLLLVVMVAERQMYVVSQNKSADSSAQWLGWMFGGALGALLLYVSARADFNSHSQLEQRNLEDAEVQSILKKG